MEFFYRPADPIKRPGALDAYGFRCDQCGEEQTTSLKLEQRRLADAHTDWHRSQPSVPARPYDGCDHARTEPISNGPAHMCLNCWATVYPDQHKER